METALSDFCVYTIVHAEALDEAARHKQPATFHEAKEWVTGRQLWERAQASGVGFAVLLGDATQCNRLGHWGLLTAVEFEGGGTRFTIDRVRELPGGHSPQELVLLSTGKRIAANFIRPYAICRTPVFLPDQVLPSGPSE